MSGPGLAGSVRERLDVNSITKFRNALLATILRVSEGLQSECLVYGSRRTHRMNKVLSLSLASVTAFGYGE